MKATALSLLTSAIIALLFAPAAAAARPEHTLTPVTPIALDQAAIDALRLAARHPHATVMRIAGVSMLPYFGDNSVVVVLPVPATSIRPGMIVVYTNHDDEQVAHRVIARHTDGWQVRGYNNDRADSTLVRDENLLGVIYAIFHSNGLPSANALHASVAAGLPIALAAPAK